MKLFLDTADTELIEKHFQTDLIDGITTNPTLIMKSGRDPEEVYQQLIDMGIDDISMEVVGDFDAMYMEGLRLSRKFGKNATIKVPCTPDVIVPAETVPAVVPSVVSILLPEIEKVEPILEASVLAASTVNCTLDVCELTIPPAYAEVPIPSNNNKGKNFFIGKFT